MRAKNGCKWALWLLSLLLLAGMQSAPGLFSLGGVRPLLLLSAVVSVALLEKNSIAACGYGILAGLLWDVSDGKLLGFYGLAVLLCCVGIVCLAESCLRQSLFNVVWLGAAAAFLCGLWEAGFYLFLWGYADGEVGSVLAGIALQSLYTGIFSLPVGLWMRLISRRSAGREENRIHS